jgi:hypothetical protein
VIADGASKNRHVVDSDETWPTLASSGCLRLALFRSSSQAITSRQDGRGAGRRTTGERLDVRIEPS